MGYQKNLILLFEINRLWLKFTLPKRVRLLTRDRHILERIIFKSIYINPTIKKMLFVGCHPYSSWYSKIFNLSGKEFHTVDPDKNSKIYGSPKKHFTEKFESLGEKEELQNEYDCIILNGVFGYGIDKSEEKILAIQTSYKILKKGGLLLIGFRKSEVPDFDQKTIDKNLFESTAVPGFESSEIQTGHQNHHVFICFKKK